MDAHSPYHLSRTSRTDYGFLEASVLESTVLYIKTALVQPYIMMMLFSIGTGLERIRGRWAGPGLLAGWGCRLLDCRGWGRTAAAADRPALDVVLPCKKNRQEEVPARDSPVAAPMPKSVSF